MYSAGINPYIIATVYVQLNDVLHSLDIYILYFLHTYNNSGGQFCAAGSSGRSDLRPRVSSRVGTEKGPHTENKKKSEEELLFILSLDIYLCVCVWIRPPLCGTQSI
jgi:hypothetical protein